MQVKDAICKFSLSLQIENEKLLVMKKKLILVTALACGVSLGASAQFKIGGKSINATKVVQAGTDAVKAITLSDADVAELCREYMVWMDEHNPIAKESSEYGKRLKKLTGHIKEVNGLKLNFAVYEVVDINAFASGDGSVRVCAGLMDYMTDDEVLAVIGHEIGHVVNTDVKDAMKSAYLRSAAKNAAGAASSTVSKLTDSEIGAMVESLAGAQFSQKQEYAADAYGFNFSVQNNGDPYGMYNSLTKLLKLSDSSTATTSSKFRQMFSSHPDTEKRAAKVKEMADKAKK